VFIVCYNVCKLENKEFIMVKKIVWTSLIAAQCLFAESADTEAAKTEPTTSSTAKMLANANNPLANFISFNIQNYAVRSLSDTDATANTAFLRAVVPTGRILWRASLPISSYSPHGAALETQQAESGLGDTNLFAAYMLSDPSSSVSYGIGPMLNAPTGSLANGFSSGNWAAGLAAVYYNASTPNFSWGALVTWSHSFTDNDDPRAKETNIWAGQYFAMFQLGNGLYTGMAPLWTYDVKNNTYDFPLGLRLGKVKKFGDTVANFFIEPQYTVLSKGSGQAEFQIFMAVNLQFTGI
jgi:hypothetical protein